jgi:hypothetical protein
MSYLAMSAATIDDENTQYETPINKKRQYNSSHSKTQKYRQGSNDFNPQKVNSVLASIHNNFEDDDDLGNYNAKGTPVSAKHSENFKPLNPFDFPAKPLSMGGERTKNQEGLANMNNDNDGLVPQPVDNENLKLQELQSNYMNDAQVRDYYKKMMPNYQANNHKTQDNKYFSSSNNNSYSSDSNQVLLEKLNYMINLLEEQQDQKTGSVTEEVVLYSFLGVFIIFIVDNFTKVGKYTR